jgi:hypothetical protein
MDRLGEPAAVRRKRIREGARMSGRYSFAEGINLHVEGRIKPEDAARQARTARSILQRLHDQPGLILADEVGMGKTFVSLAVAISVALHDGQKRPVVVMVPSSLKEKWPRDFDLFKERCLTNELKDKLRCGRAERGIEFLKMLDDPPERRNSIIFLTHGAMTRRLTDEWVKLAVIQRSMYKKKNIDDLRRALARSAPGLLQRWDLESKPELMEELLNTNAQHWLDIMKHHKAAPPDDDEPVPATVREVLKNIDLNEVYEAVQKIPKRRSEQYDERLRVARKVINDAVKDVWGECLQRIDIKLPLLILDEAHHLKNAYTRLAGLFQSEDSKADIEEISRGPLGGVFERMIFLTATPFQLGHHELCSVLERFNGIAWQRPNAPSMTRDAFVQAIDKLRDALNAAQEAGLRLDQTWGNLRPEHLVVNSKPATDIAQSWEAVHANTDNPEEVKQALHRFEHTKAEMKAAEDPLKSWVIRHQRNRILPENGMPRRNKLPGAAILNPAPQSNEALNEAGIGLAGESLLPFLLAARAAALKPKNRPVFAEGLASCYEAFMYTRSGMAAGSANQPEMDQDEDRDDGVLATGVDAASEWYLARLEECIQRDNFKLSAKHPKLEATVSRALALWESGEKVLIFCHYISTGRVLRQQLSNAINERIHALAADKMKCSPEEAQLRLAELGDKFFDDSKLRKACDEEVGRILEGYPQLQDYCEKLIDVVRRFLRTPSFLVRYFPLSASGITEETIGRAFDATDGSGLTVRNLIVDFFGFLQNRCGKLERQNYIDAVDRIQTGSHRADDVKKSFDPDEGGDERGETLVPNVRLVNGTTGQDTRQRLMLAFNTPFYPEILVASSVLAEGVDLHLYCRHVIHHDLSWNPSTLEQRNGRIDRIGAKVERCKAPIHVFFPYLAETQDEKMYRVVMDRDRWFNIVMGGKYTPDFDTMERLSQRVPFPESAAEELKFKLEVLPEERK